MASLFSQYLPLPLCYFDGCQSLSNVSTNVFQYMFVVACCCYTRKMKSKLITLQCCRARRPHIMQSRQYRQLLTLMYRQRHGHTAYPLRRQDLRLIFHACTRTEKQADGGRLCYPLSLMLLVIFLCLFASTWYSTAPYFECPTIGTLICLVACCVSTLWLTSFVSQQQNTKWWWDWWRSKLDELHKLACIVE